MKRILYFLLSAFLVIVLSLKMANAQNNVGINTKFPSTNAALDIKAVGKQGILIPRLRASDTLVAPFNAASLSNKDKGLMFYDSVGTQFLFWNGLKWKSLGGTLSAGPKGDKGDPGATGPAGPTGATGAKGDIGATGPAGNDGAVGATGPAGPTGATGAKGDIGATGTAGNDGAIGATGPAGPTGATGAKGDIGATGPAGNDGAIGATGPAGPTGATGAKGDIGATGPAGNDGAVGATGPAGPTGATGAKGDIGATGTAGNDGAIGATGPAGPTGATGAKGDIGATGPAGNDGAIGATGPAGPTGATGAKGDIGATGPAGNDGAIGATGPAGPTGATGAKGDIGATGPAGNDGAIGATGPAGPTGATGAKGDIGATGPAGNDGAIGATGPAGPTGATGAKGDIGATGPAGNDGAIGATGPAGPTGATGAKGDIGATGPAGNDGAIGATGPAGPTGATGAKGDIGATGPAGNDGAVGATGAKGDIGTTGPAGANGAVGATGPAGPTGAKGDKGDIGATGPAGNDGATGATGPAGVDGTNGATVLNGNFDPFSTTGDDGDFFINTSSNKIFGPKAAGAWPAPGTSLVGPAGTTGQTIYHDGTEWKATSNLNNNGTTVGIGTAAVASNIVLIKAGAGVATIPFAVQNNANTNSLVEIGNANGDGVIRGHNAGTTSFQLSASPSFDSYLQTNLGIGMTGPVPQKLTVNGNALLTDGNSLMFREKIADGMNVTSFRAQAQAADIVYTLPASVGVLGDVLTTNSTGVLSWTNPSTLSDWSQSGNTVTAIKKFGTIDNFDLPFITNGTEQMRITNTGKIGIGTPNPTFQLSLNGAATDADIHMFNTTSGTSGADGLRINFSGLNANILNYEGGNMNFGTAGVNRLIIKPTGNIQIPSLIGPGIVQADISGNLSIGTAVSGSGTENFLPKWSAISDSIEDSRIYDDGSYVGIGRKTPVFADGYFDIEIPTIGNAYGGMYLNSKSATGKPFYGYSLNSTVVAWNYLDGTTSDWRVNNGALDRLIVKKTGVVQIPDLAGAGSVLADAAGNLSVNKCAFAVTNAAVFKIPSKSVQTTMVFDKVLYDVSGNFGSNAFKAPETGIYHFDATVSFDPASAYGIQYKISLYKGATLVKGVNFASTLTDFSGNISADLELASGDVITVKIWQEEIINRPTLFGSANCYFNGHRIF